MHCLLLCIGKYITGKPTFLFLYYAWILHNIWTKSLKASVMDHIMALIFECQFFSSFSLSLPWCPVHFRSLPFTRLRTVLGIQFCATTINTIHHSIFSHYFWVFSPNQTMPKLFYDVLSTNVRYGSLFWSYTFPFHSPHLFVHLLSIITWYSLK